MITPEEMKEAEENTQMWCLTHKHELSKEPHKCPYKDDIGSDSDFKCLCCPECEKECGDDI